MPHQFATLSSRHQILTTLHLGDTIYDKPACNPLDLRIHARPVIYDKNAYQSKPSKRPSPFVAQALKMAHWRLFILCNSNASVTAASSSAPGRSC